MDRDNVEDIKRHFGIIADGVRSEVRAVPEGVALLTERVEDLGARFEHLQQDTRHEFAEAQALIRLSYSELDRRIRELEADVGQLKSRLERLEARH